MVVVRLKNGTDLLDGLKQAVARERITNAVAGGHVEPGTKVFTFANISIAVLSDSLDLSRNDDWNWH